MTTATTAPASITCTLKFSGTTFTVTNPNTKGSVSISLTDANINNMTSEEQNLIYSLEEASLPGHEFSAELTIPEMKALKAIHDRQAPKTAPVVTPAPTPEVVAKIATDVQKSAQHAAVMVEREAFRSTHFSPSDEREIRTLERAAKSMTGDIYKLEYDIPKALTKECPSPCGLLWGVGAFPSSESVWVIRADDLAKTTTQDMLTVWKSHGVKHWLVRYHPDDLHVLRQQAVYKLDERCRELKASITQKILNADTTLSKTQEELDKATAEGAEVTSKDRQRAIDLRNNTVRAALRLAWNDLRAVALVAERFEETDSVSELLAGLRETVAMETAVFNNLMKARQAAERLYVQEA